jgi:hypothetical protein
MYAKKSKKKEGKELPKSSSIPSPLSTDMEKLLTPVSPAPSFAASSTAASSTAASSTAASSTAETSGKDDIPAFVPPPPPPPPPAFTALPKTVSLPNLRNPEDQKNEGFADSIKKGRILRKVETLSNLSGKGAAEPAENLSEQTALFSKGLDKFNFHGKKAKTSKDPKLPKPAKKYDPDWGDDW